MYLIFVIDIFFYCCYFIKVRNLSLFINWVKWCFVFLWYHGICISKQNQKLSNDDTSLNNNYTVKICNITKLLVYSNTESFLLNCEKPSKKLGNFSTSDESSLSANSLGPQQRSISGNFLLTSTFISRLLRAEFYSEHREWN